MKFFNITSRVVLGMLVAVMIGGMSAPAFADDHRGRDHDHGHDHDHDRGRHHDRYDDRRDRGYRDDGYYAPPVVYAPPRQSLGINLIVPLNFHR